VFYDFQDAYYRSFEYIEGYYNLIRKHSSIGYLSPVQYEEQFERNNKN
jgi:transposase InsO family protein